MDVGINDRWFVNLSARYIDIDADARLGGANIGTVEVDPFVYGIHVGYRFGKSAAPAAVLPVAAAAVAPPPPPPPPVDSDGDGVFDPSDACPGTPAGTKVDARGCELDSDGDGVVDSVDRCPATPPATKVDEFGCSLAARLEVFFDTSSAVLKPESYPDLDRVVKFMQDVPRVAGVLEGHTDSAGSERAEPAPLAEAGRGGARLPGVQGHRGRPHPGQGLRRDPPRGRQCDGRGPGAEPARRAAADRHALGRQPPARLTQAPSRLAAGGAFFSWAGGAR